jgi:hypothetical protein
MHLSKLIFQPKSNKNHTKTENKNNKNTTTKLLQSLTYCIDIVIGIKVVDILMSLEVRYQLELQLAKQS